MHAARFEATRPPSFQGFCLWDTSAAPELWETRNNQSSIEMFGRGRAAFEHSGCQQMHSEGTPGLEGSISRVSSQDLQR